MKVKRFYVTFGKSGMDTATTKFYHGAGEAKRAAIKSAGDMNTSTCMWFKPGPGPAMRVLCVSKTGKVK
jgi:hypothetical protein